MQEPAQSQQIDAHCGTINQVLLVEDNDDDREYIANMIGEAIDEGQVHAVATGEEALAIFDVADLDCVILDHRLETEDGLTILHEMKSRVPSCPVIMLTGQGNEEIAAKSIKVGAADYLIKQHLNESFLRTTIESAISRAVLESKVAEQEAQRRQFLEILVHDLRAPLRNVRWLGEMAIEEAKAGDLGEMTELLVSQEDVARRANDLISTLETYALLDGEVRFTHVSLRAVAEAAKDNIATVVADRNAVVEIADLPATIGHAPQLIQLFQNLVQNGLKYNESDEPKILIETKGESDGHVVIVVSDNGIGIAERHLETIFAPLKRLWSVNKYEGTGLGLAICQKIVERHNGTIWCTSTEDQGSQFHVRLPKANT